MRQKIAARTMHASVHRQQFQMKEAGREQSQIQSCDSTISRISACSVVGASGREPHFDAREEPPTSSDANDGIANSEAVQLSNIDPPRTSFPSGSPGIHGDVHESVPGASRAHIIGVPLAAALLCWLWCAWSKLFFW
jgi:hypothetical protein